MPLKPNICDNGGNNNSIRKHPNFENGGNFDGSLGGRENHFCFGGFFRGIFSGTIGGRELYLDLVVILVFFWRYF